MVKHSSQKTVTIFGSGKTSQDSPEFATAYEAGKALANANFIVANGGYGGTMLAAAKGAREAGGEVVGVSCTAFGRSKPNEYITKEISTDSLGQRLDTLIELGDAYVVLPGGTGTLLELAKVWELKNKHFLEEAKPIILLGGFWQPLSELIASQDADGMESIVRCNDCDEMIAELKEIANKQ